MNIWVAKDAPGIANSWCQSVCGVSFSVGQIVLAGYGMGHEQSMEVYLPLQL